MAQITVSTNLNIHLQFTIPPFHRRAFAWATDFVIVLIYFFAMFRLVSNFERSQFMQENNWYIIMLVMLPASLYHLVSEVFLQGQSIGKKLFRLKVVNAEGGSATISQYLLRWLMRVSDILVLFIVLSIVSQQSAIITALSFFFLLLIADVICISVTRKSQRIGDMLAQTLVIEMERGEAVTDTIFQEIAQDYIPSYPQVMKLKDVEITRIKMIYDSAVKKKDVALAERVAKRICEVLQIPYDGDPFKFINTLLKDYNHYAHGK